MRVRQIGGLLAAVTAVAGCGATKTVTETTAPRTAAGPRVVTVGSGDVCTYAADGSISSCSLVSSSTSTTDSATPDCSTFLSEGQCTSNGITFQSVNQHSTLRLASLTAKLQGVATQSSVSDSNGQSANATGRFVIVTISLTNKNNQPEDYQNGQAALGLGNNVYSEAFNAENGPDQNSCSWKLDGIGNQGLQPGETATCDVVFDAPPADADRAQNGGLLVLLNFGDSMNNMSNAAQPIGKIRLGM